MPVVKEWIEVDPVMFDNKPKNGMRRKGEMIEFILLVNYCTEVETRKSRCVTRKRRAMTIAAPTVSRARRELTRLIDRKDVKLLKKPMNRTRWS
jgi:hypothetical protein